MKKTGILTLALLSGILSAGTIKADLSAGGSIQFVGNKAKGGKSGWENIKMINVNGKKLPQAVWNVKSSPYLLIHPKKGITFKNFSSLVFKFKIEASQGCPVYAFNLRFIDKDGEVFQYRQRVNLKKGGAFEIEIPIDKKHLLGTWSGKPANKIMDQPVRFIQIALDYPSQTAQEVKITFLSVTVETVESPKTSVARPVYTIGDCTRFFG